MMGEADAPAGDTPAATAGAPAPPPATLRSRFGPPFLLIALGLLYFGRLVVQPDGLLYSDFADFNNYHIPCKVFLVRSWQATGELPRWCPEMFAGMPFVHDPQVSAFYPLHVPLYGIAPAHLGAACSWVVVLHVLIAGLGTYAYARRRGLGTVGALTAGLGGMFAGKWLLHLLVAGHINVAPLAFVPLLLLLLEPAIQGPLDRYTVPRVAGVAVLYAAIILGTHPQFTFYTALFVAGWTLVTTLAALPPDALGRERRQLLLRWAGTGLAAAVVAGALSAVQILPALEATRHSSRTLGVPVGGETVMGAVETLLGMVGPPLIPASGWLCENRGGLGVLWLAIAACAPVLAPSRVLRWQGAFALGWLVLALGGVAALQWLPGFHLWRLPSRMLTLLGLPVALFVGTTVDALVRGVVSAEQRERCRALLLKVTGYVLVPLTLFAALLYVQDRGLRLTFYWATLLVSLPLAWWLLGQTSRAASALAAGWLAVLLLDLWALAVPLVDVRSEATVFAPSASVEYLVQRRDERGRILDISYVNPAKPEEDRTPACATPLWPNFAMVAGVEPVRGYNPLDTLRTKEYWQFITNNVEPLRALENFTLPGPGGFPLENQAIADLLGVRFLLLPSEMPLAWFATDAAARERSWRKVFEDPQPHAYSFVPQGDGGAAGLIDLPPYTVYENQGALPRAMVVHAAEPAPPTAAMLETLKRTPFRERVLLEGIAAPVTHAAPSTPATATITEYTPNRVRVAVSTAAPGFVVLNDPWYPGWQATVDGTPTPVQRANFLFRAVAVPAGEHEVVFTFEPASYATGLHISLISLAVVAACLLVNQVLFGWFRFGTTAAPSE